jgi:HprK-related kinase A
MLETTVVNRSSEKLILNNGLTLKIGPFSINIKSSEKLCAITFCDIYQGYPLLRTDEYVDFYINLQRPRNLRRFIRPYVDFLYDDKKPFKPLATNEVFPFFEWGLNWCVATHAHHYFMLHAAVVEKNGNIIIFPAAPGSGKSTLSACLMLSGWKLFSDEFALLSKHLDTITPFGRPVSLKNESINVIENKFNLKVNSLVKGTTKGDVAHLMHDNIIKDNKPFKTKNIWLVFPKYNREAKTSLTPLSAAEAFIPLVEQSFNYNQLGIGGFKSAKALIDKSHKYSFEYSNIDEAIHLFNELVVN